MGTVRAVLAMIERRGENRFLQAASETTDDEHRCRWRVVFSGVVPPDLGLVPWGETREAVSGMNAVATVAENEVVNRTIRVPLIDTTDRRAMRRADQAAVELTGDRPRRAADRITVTTLDGMISVAGQTSARLTVDPRTQGPAVTPRTTGIAVDPKTEETVGDLMIAATEVLPKIRGIASFTLGGRAAASLRGGARMDPLDVGSLRVAVARLIKSRRNQRRQPGQSGAAVASRQRRGSR